ncbi:MAG TPA: GGDEF domain-containing protein [Candidatus Acidoferrales bacterium]|nr:GGDEF domain-containing protein [Candidatus Acidoferrales bacterium]
MNAARYPKLLAMAAAILMGALALACAFLPRGLLLTGASDVIGALLMLFAMVAFAVNGKAIRGRMRWFWLLQSAGWALWLADQVCWIVYDLFLQRKMPAMFPGDALLFLAGAPMIAGLLLRPHRQPEERSARLGILDFLLVLLWWLYVYVSFVVCWQYVSPNLDVYNRNFDFLSGAETVIFAAIPFLFWLESAGAWKKFYAVFCGAVLFNGIAFYALNRAIEKDIYFTGSWYDVPYSGSFAVFSVLALMGQKLTPGQESEAADSYAWWMSNLAMIAVLSLPVSAFLALLDPRLPHEASNFRVMVTLATMFVMALLLFIQHRRLNWELRRTNVVLEEASLTDPLTGVRNRRYFSATIDGDVMQTMRSHTDGHDPHTRDLVFYLVDADNFKEVNDRYGHDVGDKVLMELARRLSSSIRHSDILVRWGGEEFLIVSRYTDRVEAELLAQRVLSAIADTPFQVSESGETIVRTCSLGWAAFPWSHENPRELSYEEVLTLADRALNRAKQAGKNQAVGMQPATGNCPAITVAGLHSSSVQVDLLAVAGPQQT